jgi:hypothetical protein
VLLLVLKELKETQQEKLIIPLRWINPLILVPFIIENKVEGGCVVFV